MDWGQFYGEAKGWQTAIGALMGFGGLMGFWEMPSGQRVVAGLVSNLSIKALILSCFYF